MIVQRQGRWQDSTVLQGRLGEAVDALKQEDGGDLHVIGSAELVRALVERDLVDELRLMRSQAGGRRRGALCSRA